MTPISVEHPRDRWTALLICCAFSTGMPSLQATVFGARDGSSPNTFLAENLADGGIFDRACPLHSAVWWHTTPSRARA